MTRHVSIVEIIAKAQAEQGPPRVEGGFHRGVAIGAPIAIVLWTLMIAISVHLYAMFTH
jgi:hypothetical protein